MKQLSIITNSRVGIIAEVTEALAAKNINIENIDAQVFEDKAIVTLEVDNEELALTELNNLHNYKVIAEDSIIIKLPNEPGALAKISRRFTDASVDLLSIRFIERNEDFGLVAISTERSEVALALIKDVLVS